MQYTRGLFKWFLESSRGFQTLCVFPPQRGKLNSFLLKIFARYSKIIHFGNCPFLATFAKYARIRNFAISRDVFEKVFKNFRSFFEISRTFPTLCVLRPIPRKVNACFLITFAKYAKIMHLINFLSTFLKDFSKDFRKFLKYFWKFSLNFPPLCGFCLTQGRFNASFSTSLKKCSTNIFFQLWDDDLAKLSKVLLRPRVYPIRCRTH